MSPDHAQALKKLFSLLFMMMGPMGLLPVFAGLTVNAERQLQVRMALYAAGYAALALTLATFIGMEALSSWGAQPSSLLVAAGLLLLVSALSNQLARPPAEPAAPPPASLGLALSPLAFPTIVSPHGVGVLILFTAYFPTPAERLLLFGVALGVVLLDLLAMLVARPLMNFLGMTPLRILGAVFGVLQTALGIEFILTGLRNAL